jgi:hypothetical protein
LESSLDISRSLFVANYSGFVSKDGISLLKSSILWAGNLLQARGSININYKEKKSVCEKYLNVMTNLIFVSKLINH